MATTYTNPSPSAPSSSYPTTYTDTKWLPRMTADTRCASETAFPSIEGPWGLKAACVISNAAEINQNAFWDVYECCPGRDMSAGGYRTTSPRGNAGICMMQCSIGDDDGVTWQQVGECLQKRVKEVICAPKYSENTRNATTTTWGSTGTSAAGTIESTDNATATGGSRSTSAAGTVATTRPGSATDASQSATAAPPSAGAANSLDVVHTGVSRTTVFIFLLLAGTSAVGILL